MVLLDTYLNEARQSYDNGSDIDLQKYNLNFHKKSTSSLGNFERVVNRNSSTSCVVYEYCLHSTLLGENVKISLRFHTNNNDIRKEGKLYSISLRNSENQLIYSSSMASSVEFDFNLIRDNFARFLLGIVAVEKYQKFENNHGYSAFEAEKEYENFGEMPQVVKNECDNIIKLVSLFEKKYGKDAFADVMKWFVEHDEDYFDILNRKTYQKPSSYFFDDKVDNQEALVYSLLEKETLFYFPLLDDIAYANKKNFLSLLKKIVGKKELSSETQYGINKITEDFFNSTYNVFIDYFKNMEKGVMKKVIPDIEDFMPIISPVRWIAIGGYTESPFFRYYEAARYFLGPGISYYPDGNVEVIDSEMKKKWEESPVTFSTLYDVLMNVNENVSSSDSNYFYVDGKEGKFSIYSHYLLDIFKKYVSLLMKETLTSIHSAGLDYSATSVVNVKRSYSLDDEDEFTSFLHSYLEAKERYLNEWGKRDLEHIVRRKYGLLQYEPDSFLNKWIREFGLGHSVTIQLDTEGQGILFKLHKDENDKDGSLVAEEGYGVTQLITLLLKIEKSILLSKQTIANVDMSDINLSRYNKNKHDKSLTRLHFSESNIAIEEPEVHLHPKFQSKLAEMFVDAYTNYNVHFIIETHSEYIIRKLQLLVANKNINNTDVSILYVYDEKNRPGYEPQVKKIGIRKDGMLNGNFGEGFFDEADMLSMFLLTAQGGEDE